MLAPGAAPLRDGENGKGLSSRWYPATLATRIREIAVIQAAVKIEFVHGDGLKFMAEHQTESDAVWFIDPPYSKSKKSAGARLYTHWQLDHDELFDLATEMKGQFLITYDNAEEITTLAKVRGFDTELIAMTNTHNATVKELVISRDLSWLFKAPPSMHQTEEPGDI